MNPIAYRIPYLGLESGNKTAGFTVTLSGPDVRRLHGIEVTPAAQQDCHHRIQERLARAKLMKKVLTQNSGVAFSGNTPVPLIFVQDPMVGGSLGRDPREMEDVLKATFQEDAEIDVLHYYPHNVDIAAQALVLVVIVQTWAEWANEQLVLAELGGKRVVAVDS